MNKTGTIPCSSQSGQVLMIGVLILLVLVMMVPAVLLMNRTSSQQGITAQNRAKGRAIAEEGVAFAVQQLSNVTNWPYLGGTFPMTGFDGSVNFASAQGGAFKIFTSKYPGNGLQSYQMGVIVRPLDSIGNVIPGSSVDARVSRHTVGAKLPTGYVASAALEVMEIPITPANTQLIVEWGPIVVRDINGAHWALDAHSDTQQRPRKFSSGCISGPVNLRIASGNCGTPPATVTDRKEWWAFTDPGFAPVIDLTYYQTIAQDTTKNTCPISPTGCSVATDCDPVPATSCYFPNVGANTAVFDGGYACTPVLPSVSCVIYVDGNATLGQTALNTASTIIIANTVAGSGNLTLIANGGYASFGETPTLIPRPSTFKLEDPYNTCGGAPCNGSVDRHIELSGFVYVRGNLTVNANTNWTLHGVMRVDKSLTLAAPSTLAVFYDDVVNHNIHTTNFELQVDSMTAIP